MFIVLRKKFIYVLILLFVAIIVIYVLWPFLIKPFYPRKYQQYVAEYSKTFNVDPFLVYSIIKAESQFNTLAQSKKGAKGLMQVTDSTGDWAFQVLGKDGFTSDKLFNPEINIMIGTWYLSWLTSEFNGNLELVVSSYNCGHGRVREWLKDEDVSKSGHSLDRIPFTETEGFTKRVLRYYKIYKCIYNEAIDISYLYR